MKPRLLRERHVQETITQFLQLDGWRYLRTEPATETGPDGRFMRSVGEVGMADALYIRYLKDPSSPLLAEVLWIEFKRKGEMPRKNQITWHKLERARGAMVLVEDDIDMFINWYKNSPYYRRAELTRLRAKG